MATAEFSGPVDYVVYAFAPGADIGPGLAALMERVEQGLVEILDLEGITLDAAGLPTVGALTALPTAADPALDLGVFEGATSGILDADDLAAVAAELQSGDFALAVVYEDRSLATAAAAWNAAGGRELFAGGVDLADLEAALAEGDPS